ncbi:MAG: hypothetical protein WC979_02275 [Candidatus Pacearchaeota archaeon]|jgi:hypothetical protein|nr:hypothetical protein [Clostridia bacterium]
MKAEINALIATLKKENEEKCKRMNGGELSEYSHTVHVHTYNQNIDFIKRLESIVNSYK